MYSARLSARKMRKKTTTNKWYITVKQKATEL